MHIPRARVAWFASFSFLVASVTSLGVGAIWYATMDRTLVIVLGRAMASPMPPWDHDHDWTRFFRMVVEPLCPAPPGFPQTTTPARSAAASCEVLKARKRDQSEKKQDQIIVVLRTDLSYGPDHVPVTPAMVCQALWQLAPKETRQQNPNPCESPSNKVTENALLWQRIEVKEDRLMIECAKGISGQLLWRSLSRTPVAFPIGDKDRPWPAGTGPYYIQDHWQKMVEGAKNQEPPHPVEAQLLPWLADQIMLRPRERSLGSLSDVVLLGLNWPTMEYERGKEIEERRKIGEALHLALEKESVHAVLQLGSIHANDEYSPNSESAQRNEVSQPVSKTWVKEPTSLEAILVAALRVAPDRLFSKSPRCLEHVRRGLYRIARDPTFLKTIDAVPVVQPLPPGMDPVFFQPCPRSDCDTPDSATNTNGQSAIDSPCDEVVLLTNDNWHHAAAEIKRRFHEIDPTLDLQIIALPPDEEKRQRSLGNFDISMLALVDQSIPPAYFLWDNLPGANWFPDESVNPQLREMADQEATGSLDPEKIHNFLAKTLDHNLIALAAPRSYDLRNQHVRGLQPRSSFLDPEQLAIERTMPFVLFWIGGGLFLPAVLLTFLLNVRAKQAEGRRRIVEQQSQFLHHEVAAPLSTIMAQADRLRKHDPKRAETILMEARIVHDLVDSSHWILAPRGLRDIVVNASTHDLGSEVIQPAVAIVQRRAEHSGVSAPIIEVDLPQSLPAVAISPTAARFVVQNLLDNALKYRKGKDLRISVCLRQEGNRVQCSVSDWGIGFRNRWDSWWIFRFGYRTRAARQRNVTGSGLGLFLSRRILSIAGGRIQLVRRADPTEFVVFFPLVNPAGRPRKRRTP